MTKKLLIVANNANWKSWPEKIEELRKWFAPKVKLTISLVHTDFVYIPFEPYHNVNGMDGVSRPWYLANVAPLATGYDMVLFVVNKDQWNSVGARGWRGGIKNGAVALQLGADEFEPFWKRLLGLDGEMFHQVARHEIMHGLFFLKCGPNVQWNLPPEKGVCRDTTHYHWDNGELEKALDDLVPTEVKPEPQNQSVIYIVHHTATGRDTTNLNSILDDHRRRYGRSFYQCFITADGTIHWQHHILNQRKGVQSADFAVVGDFTKEKPTVAQLKSLDIILTDRKFIDHKQAIQYGATPSECAGTLLENLADYRKGIYTENKTYYVALGKEWYVKPVLGKTVTTVNLNYRSEPIVQPRTRIGTLPAGTEINIVEYHGRAGGFEWVKIKR